MQAVLPDPACSFQGEESAVESRRPLPGVAQHGVSVDRRTLRERKQMIKCFIIFAQIV